MKNFLKIPDKRNQNFSSLQQKKLRGEYCYKFRFSVVLAGRAVITDICIGTMCRCKVIAWRLQKNCEIWSVFPKQELHLILIWRFQATKRTKFFQLAFWLKETNHMRMRSKWITNYQRPHNQGELNLSNISEKHSNKNIRNFFKTETKNTCFCICQICSITRCNFVIFTCRVTTLRCNIKETSLQKSSKIWEPSANMAFI